MTGARLRRDWGWFCGLALALFALRTLLTVTHQWSPEFGGDLPEALISGRLAFDLLNGSWRGWPAYLSDPAGHLAPEVAASALAVPVFALFGSSLLAMSLVPTGAALSIAWLMFSLADSPRAARLSLVYFVCVPATVQTWLIYPYFTMLESSLFFLASLWVLQPVWRADKAPVTGGWLRPFAAGTIIGVGIVVCDIQLICLASIVVAWVVSLRGRSYARALGSFCAGVAIGVIPYATFLFYKPSYFVALYGKLSGPEAISLPATLVEFSPIFWPVGNFVWGEWGDVLVGLAGLLGVLWYASRSIRSARADPTELSLICFVSAMAGAFVLLGSTTEYYLYALLAPVSLLVGNTLSRLDLRVKVFTRPINIVHAFLAISAVMSLLPILSAISPGRLNDRWNAVQVARGYAFYEPFQYPTYSGFKTRLGLEVERHATPIAGERDDTAPASKTIFLSSSQEGYFPLRQARDYYMFGIDVTYLGIRALSAQIRTQVPESYWNEAFGGAAVFLANDFLLGDLMRAFEDGTIDSAVPPSHVRFFYSELGRKLRDTGAQNRPSVRRLIESFSREQRAWVEGGFAEARYTDYRIAVWPWDYAGR